MLLTIKEIKTNKKVIARIFWKVLAFCRNIMNRLYEKIKHITTINALRPERKIRSIEDNTNKYNPNLTNR